VFKNLRTGTKLLLLCSLFIGSIVLATYSLIREKQIAIDFVRQELLGTEYLEKLRPVYAAILVDESPENAERSVSVDSALDSLAAAESQTAGSFDTAGLEQDLAAAVRKLSSEAPVGQKPALIVEALSKARNLAALIGDDSKLALDPDLNSYYLQNIVVKRVPALLSEMGELHALMHGAVQRSSVPIDQLRARHLLLDGMIRSTVEEIKRDFAAAYRGDADGRLKQASAGDIGSMISAVNSYLETANATITGQRASVPGSYGTAWERVERAWAVSQAELRRLLDERLFNLLRKLRSSLAINSLVAGLSILFAVITYRQIVRPLGQLEALAGMVRETKNFGLRANLDRQDEIGQLATAFNAMLEELASARERELADQERNTAMQAELARVARLTTMGQMAASIAHEINQPLAGVVNNANAGLRWLNRQPPDVAEVDAALRRIVSDGERGSSIIESIHAMLKKGDRKRVTLDLNELIREVMILTQGQFQRQGVSIRFALADDLPSVSADRVQLEQVILNLLLNAAEAMLSNSEQERLVWLRSEKHDGGGGALISVEDSGPGIAPENVKRIFETFFTTKVEGMGMGLSICRAIVESHGGRITVANAVPKGSVFKIFLPGDRDSSDAQ
jgi:signal transduction histidine kinase